MSYLLFKPDEAFLVKVGFQSIAHVPVIFNDKWAYQREANRWLRERAIGEDVQHEDGGGNIPTRQSLITIARCLIDFLAWCDWADPRPKKLDPELPFHPWKEIEYTKDLRSRYQKSMLDGSWSFFLKPLSPSTINSRVSEAARFCKWAVRVGLREKPFDIPYDISYRKVKGISSHSHKVVEKKSRKGLVRPHPSDLRLPTIQQVEKWFNSVKIKKGPTLSLMCRLVMEVGLRREECCQWDLEYLGTDPTKWQVKFGYVILKIKYGTKGPDYAEVDNTLDGCTKYPRVIGPTRIVYVPLDLAHDLIDYRNKIRLKLLSKYINNATSKNERELRIKEVKTWHRLFLSDYDGRPINGPTLLKAFKVNPPYPEWQTHLGRHYFACYFMLNKLRQDWKIEKTTDLERGAWTSPPPDWVMFKGQAALLMLKKLLGHVNEKTSEMYLVWLLEAFNLHSDYVEALEGALPKSEGGEEWQTHGA